jgi:hypothetical protein
LKFDNEEEMREPVHRFLESLNYRWKDEVRLFSREIDIVGRRKNTVFSVELKLRDWNRALQQAFLDLRVSNYVSVALPDDIWGRVDPRLFSLAASYGIGLISVDGEAKQIMRPRASTFIQSNIRKKFLKRLGETHS